MSADERRKAAVAAPDEPEPVTIERVEWMVYDPETDGYLFGGDRVDCERWMERLCRSRPTVVLVREDVRTVSQTWRSNRQVIPWHSPCDWIAEGDAAGNQIGPSWCTRHKHREGEPVPAEHIHGASPAEVTP